MIARTSLVFMLLWSAAPALAQQPAPPASTGPAPLTAGWQDGFVLQTANGDYRLQIGLLTQIDGRFDVDQSKGTINTFAIRKARPILQGRLAKYFDYRFMPDFGNGAVAVMDAYLDVRFSTKFRVRTGKDKTPIGYDILTSDGSVIFPERAFPSSLVANRDVGVQALGDLAAGRVSYAGGIFNGVPDGTSGTTEADANADKDLAGRLVVQPFRVAAGHPASLLSGFGAALGGSTGKQTGALPAFKTSVGQTFFSYTSATANGPRRRIAPAVFYYAKAFGVFAEFTQSTQAVLNTKSGLTQNIQNRAWNITGEYNLTGEEASTSIPRPKRPFDPPSHAWGALTLVARYSELRLDPGAFAAGEVTSGSSQRAQMYTIGVNWIPVYYVKYYLNYERTVFDGNPHGGRPAENVLFLRAQLAF